MRLSGLLDLVTEEAEAEAEQMGDRSCGGGGPSSKGGGRMAREPLARGVASTCISTSGSAFSNSCALTTTLLHWLPRPVFSVNVGACLRILTSLRGLDEPCDGERMAEASYRVGRRCLYQQGCSASQVVHGLSMEIPHML